MRGCRILGEGRVVVTDRLHGHILCLLMNIPHVLIGDKYGKIESFYDAWTKSCDLTVWADSLMDALAAGRTLARAPDGSAGSEHANTHDDFARGSVGSATSSMVSVERSKAKRPLL
jgi:hypothetical protein